MLRRSTRSMKRPPSPSKEAPNPAKNPRKTNDSNRKISEPSSAGSDEDFVESREESDADYVESTEESGDDFVEPTVESDEDCVETKEKLPKSKKLVTKAAKRKFGDTSSSESDIEDYLLPIDKIDLNSSLFDTGNCKENVSSFDKIEKEIFSGVTVTRLSDSDTSEDEEKKPVVATNASETTNIEPFEDEDEMKKFSKEGEKVAKLNFQKLLDNMKQIEEAKKSVEQYKANQAVQCVEQKVMSEEKINIEDILNAGEVKHCRSKLLNQSSCQSVSNQCSSQSKPNKSSVSTTLNSSSYETYSDSEQEDWEEIHQTQENDEKPSVPKKGLEITLEMPTNIKKKKGDDLLSAVKRRLNRIRKENQLLIHKVHLLCWIAHGNYVNSVLNDQGMMALGLSLIPSERCYPSGRIDLSYLEQILKWYKRTVKLAERVPSKSKSLNALLTEQIDKKEAYTKKMLALIFIIILRSLGIQCRLVLSLQVEPLRPPNSDLHFLGNPSESKKKGEAAKSSETASTSKSEETKPKLKKLTTVKVAQLSENSKPHAESTKKDSKDYIEKGKRKNDSSNKSKSMQNMKSAGKRDSSRKDTYMKISGTDEMNSNTNSKNKMRDEKSEEKCPTKKLIVNVTHLAENSRPYGESTKKDHKGDIEKDKFKNNSSNKGKSKQIMKRTKLSEKKIENSLGTASKNSGSTFSETKKKSSGNDTYAKEPDSDKRNSNINSENELEDKKSDINGQTKKLIVKVNQLSDSDSKKDVLKSKISKSEKRESQRSELKVPNEKKCAVGIDNTRRTKRTKAGNSNVEAGKNIRSKSASTSKVKLDSEGSSKSRSKSTSSSNNDLKSSNKEKIAQLDGSDDGIEEFKGFGRSTRSQKTLNVTSFEDFYAQVYNQVSYGIKTRSSMRIPQLDGTSDEPSTSKPYLNKLKKPKNKSEKEDCMSQRHRRRQRKPNYADGATSDSDDDFVESPKKKLKVLEREKNVDSKKKDFKPSPKMTCSGVSTTSVNLKKLKDLKNKKVAHVGKSIPSKPVDVKNDIMELIKGRISEQKQIDRSRMVKKKTLKYRSESDDSDYVPEAVTKKYHSDSDNEFYPKMKVKQRVQVKKEVKKIKKLKKPKDMNSRKVISSDSEYTEEEIIVSGKKTNDESSKKKKGNDTWAEVFLETEEKWISVDVIFGQVHCVNELYSRAPHPVSYVLAWNNVSHVKDITRRYCQNFNTVTRKLRIDHEWWEKSLSPFIGPKNARDREEDDELNREQLEKPLPTTISEYKNHPLYALERHLLKFEALYPPNAPPLGFVRNEPVYSRDCIHVCHSRDIWLKQAKVVKLKEKPYKIVKARPKYDRLSNTMITGQNLEIFGPWQVEDYDPPSAENGVVPRNAFGNVDLFKPTMLPKKCVHLQLPGLNKIARRMNIDCAAAIVGFDFHGGWSHPVYDGFVVCEEFEDQLVAAWNIEQEEIEQKEQEKYEKRVYGNWKKLIKGLWIRERLKMKYGFGQKEDEPSTSLTIPSGKEKKKSKSPTFCTKKRRVISDSDSDDDKK